MRDLRVNELKKAQQAQEISQVQKRVDTEVDRWAASKDLRAMLATMGQIWPGARSVASEVNSAVLKKTYLKALRLVHPDKVDANAPVRTKVIAQRLFTTLQQHRPT